MTTVKTLCVLLVLVASAALAQASGCELYCDSKLAGFMANCQAADLGQADCDYAWGVARQQCIDSQCSLEVEVPDRDRLVVLAEIMARELLGPEFEIVDMNPHLYDSGTDEPGTLVFTCRASDDESRFAFLEVGTSIDFPPVVSYGFDLPAADALRERVVDRLNDEFGPADYRLTRRFLTAAHPILEFSDGWRNVYYMVADSSVSQSFSLTDDPDADQSLLEIRRQANRRLWNDTLNSYLY